MRRFLVLALLAILAGPRSAHASWAPDGNPVVLDPADQYGVAAGPFGAGGVLVAWVDLRNPGSAADIYASALTTDGDLAPGWPVDGLPVCTAAGAQLDISLAADGEGGAYLAWRDLRDGASAVYLQRVTGAGAIATGWPTDGLLVAGDTLSSAPHSLAPDGVGGVFTTWLRGQGQNEGSLRVGRITGSGEVASGWPEDGVVVGIGSGGSAPNSALVEDGSGGVFVGWVGPQAEAGPMRTLAQRLMADGMVHDDWPADGRVVAEGGAYGVKALGDGSGGAFVAWTSERACPHFFNCNRELATRVSGSGVLVPGWTFGGLDLGYWGPVAADAAGGIVSTWNVPGCSPVNQCFRAFATRVDGDAAREPGWDEEGNPVCSEPRDQNSPAIVGDGLGGAFVSWIDLRSQASVLYQSRLSPSGTVAGGWPETGSMAAPAAVEPEEPLLVAVGPGRAIGVWTDRRNGSRDIFAEEVVPGPPGPPAPLAVGENGSLGFGISWVGPNPSTGLFWVVIELPRSEPGTLELIDLAGRIVEQKLVVSAAPRGPVRLGHSGRAPGVYWIRLRQGPWTATARVVIAS